MGIVSVGTTAVSVAQHNRRRTSLTISNPDTAAVIYTGKDSTVTTGNGVPLFPQTIVTFNKMSGDDPTIERWVISDTAGKNVRFEEEFA